MAPRYRSHQCHQPDAFGFHSGRGEQNPGIGHLVVVSDEDVIPHRYAIPARLLHLSGKVGEALGICRAEEQLLEPVVPLVRV